MRTYLGTRVYRRLKIKSLDHTIIENYKEQYDLYTKGRGHGPNEARELVSKIMIVKYGRVVLP